MNHYIYHKIQVTYEDIAEGVPEDPCRCPVARAVHRHFRVVRPIRVFVRGTFVDFVDEGRDMHLSTEAQDFITRFDLNKNVEPFEVRLREFVLD